MDEMVRLFNEKAAAWDENPARRALSTAVALGVIDVLPVEASWEVLDLGCGTGAVSLQVRDRVRRIDCADASQGMLAVLAQNIAREGAKNLKPILVDLESDYQELGGARYDLIVCSMMLHHVERVLGLLWRLRERLRPGGWLAVADLVAEDGSFHGADAVVPHHGFVPEDLEAMVGACGLLEVTTRTIHTMFKADAGGERRAYPVFLLTAQCP